MVSQSHTGLEQVLHIFHFESEIKNKNKIGGLKYIQNQNQVETTMAKAQ
jgi:hypothetical protein